MRGEFEMTLNELFTKENLDKLGLTKKRLEAKVLDCIKKTSSTCCRYKVITEIEEINVITFKN